MTEKLTLVCTMPLGKDNKVYFPKQLIEELNLTRPNKDGKREVVVLKEESSPPKYRIANLERVEVVIKG